MARNINDRLSQLNTRRKGIDRLDRLPEEYANEVRQRSTITEDWERRASGQPHTLYALGAMQEVTPRYTEISIETAQRVGKQLINGLSRSTECRLQGSVPLNVHIRGVSDVDLLIIDTQFFTYETHGRHAQAGSYSPTIENSMDVLRNLRANSERILRDAYPRANVNCSKGKCIALSGGSLARPVDVVPSHWHETYAYQASGAACDRGITIYDKKIPRTVNNLPFLHIDRVHNRDTQIYGGLKKAIRLVKNVKNDAENDGTAAKLPSFDIAALMYHADQAALRSGIIYELAILFEARRFMDWCYGNKDDAKRLRTPDGLRFILDSDAKIDGLTSISVELDKLAREVAKEQNSTIRSVENPDWSIINDTLRSVRIPG